MTFVPYRRSILLALLLPATDTRDTGGSVPSTKARPGEPFSLPARGERNGGCHA
jgi:hypothetical protein